MRSRITLGILVILVVCLAAVVGLLRWTAAERDGPASTQSEPLLSPSPHRAVGTSTLSHGGSAMPDRNVAREPVSEPRTTKDGRRELDSFPHQTTGTRPPSPTIPREETAGLPLDRRGHGR